VSEKQKSELFSQCKAFINPQQEDFGITAVESMASGRPVIAYRAGGALDTIVENQTGIFFNRQNWEDLAYCVLHFDKFAFFPEQIRDHAKQFDTEMFKRKINQIITQKINSFSS
jgi:glycosyltransferase involved in cell wall biosynthesis